MLHPPPPPPFSGRCGPRRSLRSSLPTLFFLFIVSSRHHSPGHAATFLCCPKALGVAIACRIQTHPHTPRFGCVALPWECVRRRTWRQEADFTGGRVCRWSIRCGTLRLCIRNAWTLFSSLVSVGQAKMDNGSADKVCERERSGRCAAHYVYQEDDSALFRLGEKFGSLSIISLCFYLCIAEIRASEELLQVRQSRLEETLTWKCKLFPKLHDLVQLWPTRLAVVCSFVLFLKKDCPHKLIR